ncbi:MAG: glycerophosphodiester phosphodiesterase [Nitrospinae bacterium]|nr:glycerophosphodiester phosphodiesterase [Nitrospinota bacterium]
MQKTLIIGHRGAPRFLPENTIPSFEKAIDLGADGIELDVQLSSDGKLVVIHDELINRTTEDETGLVRDFELAQLKRMDFGGWFDRSCAGIRIPTLEEVFELIKEKTGGDMNKVHLDIELKTGIVPYPKIEEKVVELIHKYKRTDNYTNLQCSSFYHQSLVTIKEIDKSIPIGVLYAAGLYEPWNYAERLSAQSLNPLFYALSQDPETDDLFLTDDLLNCKKQNLKYFPYTVDQEKDIVKMLGKKVDGIITNRPDVALAIRKEWEKA